MIPSILCYVRQFLEPLGLTTFPDFKPGPTNLQFYNQTPLPTYGTSVLFPHLCDVSAFLFKIKKNIYTFNRLFDSPIVEFLCAFL